MFGIEQGPDPDSDLLVRAAGHTFVVGVVSRALPGLIAARAECVTAATNRLDARATPLLAAPFMTDSARQACEAAGAQWIDLCGNARIVVSGLRVIVDGYPNRFRVVGRPSSVFAPKSARVVRWLLMHSQGAVTQRMIARATDMDEGFVSRIASRLEHESYVVRDAKGSLRVRDPALLLDAWHAEYRFDRHTLIPGLVADRSGDALTRFVGDTLAAEDVEHAATGFSAAWRLTPFSSFRVATYFIAAPLTEQVRTKLGFQEEARGANLWLVIPNDVGVLHGAKEQGGVRCVHPVQAYVDLKGHPERAKEAADRLRETLVASWGA